jgi:hypothetical protein
VFHFVGASSEKFTPSAEDLPSAFKHIEGEINDLDEVIAGHGDFCALAASRGTSVAFLKSGCEHGSFMNADEARIICRNSSKNSCDNLYKV